MDNSGYIEYTLRAYELKAKITQTVSYDGVVFNERINAAQATDLYYRIAIQNLGDNPITNVCLKGIFSDGLSLIQGSVRLTTNDSIIPNLLPDNFSTNGYNLGTIGTGNTVYITYRCHISETVKKGFAVISAALLTHDSESPEGESTYAIALANIYSLSITPWGPERKTFTNENPAPYVSFNSITDNAGIGDERNFVRIREANANDKFADEVKMVDGKVYEVFIYYQNDASPSLADTENGIARDVRVKSSFPHIINSTKKFVINATLSSSNSNPESVWDGAFVFSDEELMLNYIPNSLRLHSYTETHGQVLNADDMFSEQGVLISTHNDRPGIINCKDEETGGHITYCILARKTKSRITDNNEYIGLQPQFGPTREVFTWKKRANYAVFNSIIDNPSWGDERYFVKIREYIEGENTPLCSSIKLKKGREYEVVIYYHNNSDPDSVGKKAIGISDGSAVRSSFPDVVRPEKEQYIFASIFASDTIPLEVWARAFVYSDETCLLHYVPDTAVFHNSGLLNKKSVGNMYLFGNGALIGFNKISGLIPGGDEYAGYISYRFLVESPGKDDFLYDDDISIPVFNAIVDHPRFGNEKEFLHIRERGDKRWQRSIYLQEGMQYEVEVLFRNDASSKYNSKDYDNRGVAWKTILAVDMPKEIKDNGTLGVRISAENAPIDSKDSISLKVLSEDPLLLRYIPGTAKIFNQWNANESVLPSRLFDSSTGALIGLNALNGVIPGGDDYSGRIRFVFEVSDPLYNHSGYGRQTFTAETLPNYPAFNSVINNPEVGDERSFVSIRENNSDASYTNCINIEPGKEYEVKIYYINNANPQTNPKGYGIARGVRVSTEFPERLSRNQSRRICGMISWVYSNPDDHTQRKGRIWSDVKIIAKTDVSLRYKIGSSRINNKWEANGSILSTTLFSKNGTYIGLNELNGLVPGGIDYSGSITYILIAEKSS